MSEQLSKPEQKTFNIDKDNLASFMKAVIYGSVVILVIVLAVYFTNFHNGISDKQEVWGAFGDFVGGILNPIFGLFGLIALLITITLQTKELEATHIELRRSAHAQELMEQTAKEQAKTAQQQRFESTFFSLLEQHNKLVEKITDTSRKNWSDGKTDLQTLLFKVLKQNNVVDAAKIATSDKSTAVHQYFSVLHHLLKFISSNNPGESALYPTYEEKMYCDIARSFITNDILIALTFYCLREPTSCPSRASANLKSLVERYRFLENIQYDQNQRELISEAETHYFTAFGL